MKPLPLALLLAACHVPCGNDVDCHWNEICDAGVCEPALDRAWEVTVDRAEVSGVHPDGNPWDLDGSPPDLFVEVGTSAEACATSTDWDDYTPTWSESCDLWIASDDWLALDLWDQDDSIDELVTSVVWEGERALADLARSRDRWLRVWDPSETVWMEIWLSPRQ